MFFDIYQNLCREKGLSVNAVAKNLFISSGAVSEWKKGRIPRNSTLKKIAEFFDVSTDYLLGTQKGEDQETKKPLPENEERLKQLYDMTAGLSDADIDIVTAFVAGLKANHKND